jgi:CheY-like chemotaxis protein
MKSILIVDDEDAISETVAEVLQDEGYQCSTASNGQEALDLMSKARPDLVVCDVMMPVLDGREMLRRMRASPELAPIPVIMMSAAPSAFTGAGVDSSALLRKPFRLETLQEMVTRIIGPP